MEWAKAMCAAVRHQRNARATSMKTMSSASIDQLTPKTCSKCGAGFGCGAMLTNGDCWCAQLPHVAPVVAADQDCLCAACLAEAIEPSGLNVNEATDTPLLTSPEAYPVEGEDYYLEGAAMVFTARFLRRRGYCCESGCRHCPFDVARATAPGPNGK